MAHMRTGAGYVWPPPLEDAGPVETWVTAPRVLGIPAVGRVVGLITGMIGAMPLNAVRGRTVLPRPALLDWPQPESGRDRSWFVSGQVQDWWIHGNCVQLVTSRGEDGLPSSVMWLPAERVSVLPTSPGSSSVLEYRFDGRMLDEADVIHVRRGADPRAPWRGIGVLEQHMRAFSRVSDQERYEQSVLNGAAVPSVVVITPGEATVEQEEEAKKRWEAKFSGPARRPAFVPAGTEVVPLSWSPRDQQLTEARQLSLVDVANIANLDSYWLGASTTGYSYKSPGPMFLNLLRQTLQPIFGQFEGSWGREWLPDGQDLRFDTQAILGDDMATTIGWLTQARAAGLITLDEAREYIGKSPLPPDQVPVPLGKNFLIGGDKDE